MKKKKYLAIFMAMSMATATAPVTALANEETDATTDAVTEDKGDEPVAEEAVMEEAAVADTPVVQEASDASGDVKEEYVAKIGETGYATLADALAVANTSEEEDVTITLQKDVVVDGTNPIKLEKADMVLDGNGHKITATGEWNVVGFKNVITVLADDIAIRDLKLDCGGCKVSGIHVYNCDGAKLEGVEITNFKNAGVIVNSATAEATDLTVEGATGCWGSVNVDKKTDNASKFTFVRGDLKDGCQIYTDTQDAEVVADGLTAVTVDGQTGKAFYTDDVVKLVEALTKDNATFEASTADHVYTTFAEAVANAENGATVQLLKNITLTNAEIGDKQGIVAIEGKKLTIDGNKKTITVGETQNNKGSAFNVVAGADVTFKDLTLVCEKDADRKSKAKHGLNVYEGTVTVENCEIKDFGGYAIVCGGSTATVNGLKTSGNGWGGINVDVNSSAKDAMLIINDATIAEENSVYFEHTNTDATLKVSGEIYGGSYNKVDVKEDTKDAVSVEVSGGVYTEDPSAYLANKYRVTKDNDGRFVVSKKPSKTGSSSGGGGGSTATTNKTTISDTENGKVTASSDSAKAGSKVTLTPKADEGYVLDKITVKDKDGKEVALKAEKDGTYSFTMPKGGVTVDTTFKLADGTENTDKPAAEDTKTIVLQIGSTAVIVDNQAIINDVAPVIRNDRTLVPIRVITEALGGQVAWNEAAKEVTLTINGKEIKMTIGKTLEKYGVAPVIIGDRTFVPVRFVADELGAVTTWDDATKTVTIKAVK